MMIIAEMTIGMALGTILTWLFINQVKAWKRFDAATERLINQLDGNCVEDWKDLSVVNKTMLEEMI